MSPRSVTALTPTTREAAPSRSQHPVGANLQPSTGEDQTGMTWDTQGPGRWMADRGALDEFGGQLLDDDDAFAVLAVLGQGVGERLGCLFLGLGFLGCFGAMLAGEQPVRLLHDGYVRQVRAGSAGGLVVLGDGVEQQRHHQGLLVPGAKRSEFEDHRMIEKPCYVVAAASEER